MSDDVDRWVNLEGPEPEGVRQLLDGSVEPPDPTPEREEELDRRLFAAVHEKRAQRARRRAVRRTVKWVGVGAVAAFAIAAEVVLVLRFANTLEPPIAEESKPIPEYSRSRELPEPSRSQELPWLNEPPRLLEYTVDPEDAGPVQRSAPR